MDKIKYLIIIILLFITASCTLRQTIKDPSAIRGDKSLEDGLIAYYSFEGNANDMSGNNNDGTVMGAVLTYGRSDRPNSAYSFDGTDDYIYVNDIEKLRITGQISLSVWFKTDFSLPFAGIICKADPIEPRRGYLIDIDSNDKIRTDVCFDHSNGECGTIWSHDILTDDKWHHVLVTYNGRELLLFIDGKLENNIVYEKGLQTNREPLLIGWDMNTWLSHRHFKGSIDEVRIYNRVLSKREIRRLYHEN